MPYCPKCDMEFVEGITVCTDCGGPLVESEEVYREALKKEREKQKICPAGEAGDSRYGAQALDGRTVGELSGEHFSFDREMADGKTGPFDQNADGEMKPFDRDADDETKPFDRDADGETKPFDRDADGESSEAASELKLQRRAVSASYVTAGDRCENQKSSASAFLLVGGLVTVFSAACWLGFVRLPMAQGSRLFFQAVITVMGLLFLLISYKSYRSLAALRDEAAKEEARTKELIDWFLASWSKEALDRELLQEDSSLEGEELELKRFELIQDHFITGKDLPDPAYVDYLAEEVYGRIFE